MVAKDTGEICFLIKRDFWVKDSKIILFVKKDVL